MLSVAKIRGGIISKEVRRRANHIETCWPGKPRPPMAKFQEPFQSSLLGFIVSTPTVCCELIFFCFPVPKIVMFNCRCCYSCLAKFDMP